MPPREFEWHRWLRAIGLLVVYLVFFAISWQLFGLSLWGFPLALVVAALLIRVTLWLFNFVFGLSFWVFVGPVIALIGRDPTRWLHGSARFQRASEIVRGPLAKDDGQIWLGAYKPRLHDAVFPLTTDGREHVLVCGPTRAGKGISNVLPTALSYRGSIIAHDRKGELHELTAGWRQSFSTVVKLAFAEPDSARWNPLSLVRVGTEAEAGDCENIATCLIEEGLRAEDHFWVNSGRALLAALIQFTLSEKPGASLADVAAALSDPKRPIADLYQAMLQHPAPLVSGTAADMLNLHDGKTAASIVHEATNALRIFRTDPIVRRNTSGVSEVDFDRLADDEKPVSVYLVVRPVDQERLRPLLRLAFEMALNRLMSVPLKFSATGAALSPHRFPTLLLLDEMASLGRLPAIESGLAMCLGFGVTAMCVIQDHNQLVRAFGQHETISANCGIRIYFPPDSIETAGLISRQLGNKTVTTAMTSTSAGTSGSRSFSSAGEGSTSSSSG